MKKQKNIKLATKIDVEETVGELAKMTAKEFPNVYKEFSNVHKKIDTLNDKVDSGFDELRKEMHQGFQAVLSAVESVEYTKLRMRIDVLESDMAKVKEKIKV